MLSNKTQKYLVKSLRAAAWFCAAPYRWDKKSRRIEVVTSKFRLFGWALNFIFEVCFEIFIIFRLFQAYTANLDTISVAELVNLKYKAIVYTIPIVYQLATCVRWDQFPQFVNHYMEFYDYVKENYLAAKKRNVKIRNSCDVVMPYIYYLGITIAALQSLSIFLKPQQMTLFSSLLTNTRPKGLAMLPILPISCFHSYLCFAFCFKMQLYIFALLAYTSPTLLIVSELKLSYNSGAYSTSWTSNTIRSPHHFVHIYRCLEAQQRMFNEVFTKIELPCVKMALMGVTIFGIYGCVKLEDMRVMVLAVVATAAIITLKSNYTVMANLYDSSDNVLGSWKCFVDDGGGEASSVFPNALLRRKLMSFRPLTSTIGGMYCVDTTSVLVIMRIISEQTVSVLIAF